MASELRELQRIIQDARFKIGNIIEKAAVAIKESDQVLRIIFEDKQEEGDTQPSVDVPVETEVHIKSEQRVGANRETSIEPSGILRLRGGGFTVHPGVLHRLVLPKYVLAIILIT